MFRNRTSGRTQGATLTRRAPLRRTTRRALAGAVSAALVVGLVPLVAAPAQAAGVTITGTVKNQAGQPVAATVEVSPAGGGRVLSATTNAAGAFTLSGVPAGSSYLDASETGEEHLYTPEHWNGTASVPSYVPFTVPTTDVTGVSFVLDPATGILGIATDEAGKPLQNIGWSVLEYRPEQGDWYPPQMGPLLTDEAGRMWWTTQVGKKYRLCFSDDWYDDPSWRPATRYADRCWDQATSQDTATTITVTEQTRRQVLTVELPAGGKSMLPGTPFVTGAAKVGGTLSVDPGQWTPSDVALTYRWYAYRDGTRIDLPATGRTYTPTTDLEAGDSVSVEVTGTRSGYKSATRYGYGGEIGQATPTLSAPVKITGTPTPGNTLTASWGTLTPSVEYPMLTWYVDGQADGRGTSSGNTTFTVTTADLGKRVEARLEAYSTGYNPLRSAASVTIGAPLTAATPTITGTLAVGKTLTATAGAWGPAPVTLAYQWYRSGAAIAGATSSTYPLAAADRATTITVKVTGSKPGYVTAARTSAATTAVLGVLTAPTPTISGTTAVGSKLTLSTGTWGPAPVALNYRWYRSGVAISGATATTYTLTASDRGKTITVHVAGRKTGYVSANRSSAATAAIRGVLTPKTPTVSGTRKVGSTLKAVPGTWGPAPVTLAYQWYRGSTAITGAKSASYKLVAADKGTTIKVRVTGSKSGYVSAARYSAATAKIA
ncbi:carboxypeptidase regulatory-like domain-containing protein [Cellulomonas sp. PhB150]|uniref:carboxypeptidase regulatory-like domain-containing protein n=1 Tax=Cellulomonas sp. PhB150 TaxID=2485188 RepID=UPI000F4A0336|nr:carboxypeptidase regulatory-like domain-containing protein [Cellulomonas sp. PhB150]ROS30859.1 carboxypeptidase family protein [Cellulomonas sp. PhB150]